jgi:hypothetical protein
MPVVFMVLQKNFRLTLPKVCLARISMGGFLLKSRLSTVSLENTMLKMHSFSLPVALFCSALAISACATKPQEAAVTEPAPVAAPAPEAAPALASTTVADQPVPVAAVATEQPAAPKPVVKKARKKTAKAAPPKAAPVEPVAAPAPVVKQEAPAAVPAAQEPAPAVVVTPLAPAAASPGFLEKYWMWLLGLVVAVIAFLLMKKKD